MDIILESVMVNSSVYSYFYIIRGKSLYNTSRGIAKLFKMDVNEYNKKLIKEVIGNNKYEINDEGNSLSSSDLNFVAENISPEENKIYVDRFKNAFIKELTILKIGGD